MSNAAQKAALNPPETLREAHRRVLGEAIGELLSRRTSEGHWRGQLSSSALSTAVVTFALAYAGGLREPDSDRDVLVRGGLDWLSGHANRDGGYGDTVRSLSNLPTTTLCWASLSYAVEQGLAAPAHRDARDRAAEWIEGRAGSLEPESLKKVIEDLYGDDKTFSVPILTLCALAGVLGPVEQAFRGAPALPFELALFPQSFFKFLGLPVVSYALPALIAVGQVQHRLHPTKNSLLRPLRDRAVGGTLEKLGTLQPTSGGFLEATPLTGFVTLSLAGAGEAHHPVVGRAFRFFEESVLDDGSWPIDVDLATWVSTLSVQALAEADALDCLGDEGLDDLRHWLTGQQYREPHPYTGAAPGGWAWTDLPGGVPDADDTPGALLALRNLSGAAVSDEERSAAAAGVEWLLDLQNRDGGLPTFCRGWGKLPFDRSSPDLTAHGLRAYAAWYDDLPAKLTRRVDRASAAAIRYLRKEQQADGSWVPLWFGNEHDGALQNKTYGTSKVVLALASAPSPDTDAMLREGLRYLLLAQNEDGGWGGAREVRSSFEETALAVDALASVDSPAAELLASLDGALSAGVRYLVDAWDRGDWRRASPIGFYFANLWYFEDLYPLTFGVAALARAAQA